MFSAYRKVATHFKCKRLTTNILSLKSLPSGKYCFALLFQCSAYPGCRYESVVNRLPINHKPRQSLQGLHNCTSLFLLLVTSRGSYPACCLFRFSKGSHTAPPFTQLARGIITRQYLVLHKPLYSSETLIRASCFPKGKKPGS